MPLKPSAEEEVGPTGAHFALLLDDRGTRMAIRPGASLWLVEDKADASKIFPLKLSKVSLKKIQFELPHPDGGVSQYTYQLTSTKPIGKKALERLVRNRLEGGKQMPKIQK